MPNFTPFFSCSESKGPIIIFKVLKIRDFFFPNFGWVGQGKQMKIEILFLFKKKEKRLEM
jgi:hypothetical protein